MLCTQYRVCTFDERGHPVSRSDIFRSLHESLNWAYHNLHEPFMLQSRTLPEWRVILTSDCDDDF